MFTAPHLKANLKTTVLCYRFIYTCRLSLPKFSRRCERCQLADWLRQDHRCLAWGKPSKKDGQIWEFAETHPPYTIWESLTVIFLLQIWHLWAMIRILSTTCFFFPFKRASILKISLNFQYPNYPNSTRAYYFTPAIFTAWINWFLRVREINWVHFVRLKCQNIFFTSQNYKMREFNWDLRTIQKIRVTNFEVPGHVTWLTDFVFLFPP